jgi:hypothetical protein
MSPAMVAAAALRGRVADVRRCCERGVTAERTSRRGAAWSCAGTTSTPTDHSRALHASIRFAGLKFMFRDSLHLRRRAEAIRSTTALPRRAILVVNQNFGCGSSRRRAAGTGALGNPRRRQRVVRGDLLRELRRAQDSAVTAAREDVAGDGRIRARPVAGSRSF